jgi:hypothetical protein
MASEPYRRLVLDAGGSAEEYAEWLGRTLRNQLLG